MANKVYRSMGKTHTGGVVIGRLRSGSLNVLHMGALSFTGLDACCCCCVLFCWQFGWIEGLRGKVLPPTHWRWCHLAPRGGSISHNCVCFVLLPSCFMELGAWHVGVMRNIHVNTPWKCCLVFQISTLLIFFFFFCCLVFAQSILLEMACMYLCIMSFCGTSVSCWLTHVFRLLIA